MKVLQLHTRYRERGGEDRVVDAERELLRRAGHEVLLHEEENPSDALRTARDLALATWNPRSVARVRRVVRRCQPDVTHVHNTWFAMSPAVLSAVRAVGVPTVMTLHNYRLTCANGLLFRDGRPCEDCVGSHPGHGVIHRCYRDSAAASAAVAGTIGIHRRRGTWWRDVDLFLTPSAFARGRLIAGGVPAGRIRVKPNFVQDPGARHRRPSESQTVLFVGRLSQEKGVGLLLEAWRRGAPRHLRLMVVGDGPLRNRLENSAPPGVTFLGSLSPDAVSLHMLQARAALVPSLWYETFGLVTVEAMAAGLAVLAADRGATAEVAGELDRALVPAGDMTAWTAGLQRLASDAFVDEQGRRGREIYERHYSERVALQNLESAFAEAIEPLRGA